MRRCVYYATGVTLSFLVVCLSLLLAAHASLLNATLMGLAVVTLESLLLAIWFCVRTTEMVSPWHA